MRCVLALAVFFCGVFPRVGIAAPIALTVTGTVPAIGGVPSQFIDPPVSVGDLFTATLTYDPLALLTGPDPVVDTYMNAVQAIGITFHTSSGDIRYDAIADSDPTLGVNFASVRASDVFFHISYVVQGPSVSGAFNGTTTTYSPNFLALEFMGDWSTYLAGDTLPLDLLANTQHTRKRRDGGPDPDSDWHSV
jgi:hypothetical protein